MARVSELQYADRLREMDSRLKGAMLKQLDRVFTGLQGRFDADALARVARFLRILREEEEAHIEDPRQKPSVLFFPGIEARPWHETSRFAWFEKVEAAHPVIKQELEALFEAPDAFHQESSPTFSGPQKGWKVALLDQHGRRHLHNIRRCPRTMAVVDEHIPHSLRECQFSSFEPGTHVEAHHGIANVILTCHIAVISPPTDAGVTVGGETRYQVEGKGLVFDDTFLHEAWNEGASTRTVLMWDIWHPDLTPIEITALTAFFPTFERYLLHNSANYVVANGSVYTRRAAEVDGRITT